MTTLHSEYPGEGSVPENPSTCEPMCHKQISDAEIIITLEENLRGAEQELEMLRSMLRERMQGVIGLRLSAKRYGDANSQSFDHFQRRSEALQESHRRLYSALTFIATQVAAGLKQENQYAADLRTALLAVLEVATTFIQHDQSIHPDPAPNPDQRSGRDSDFTRRQ